MSSETLTASTGIQAQEAEEAEKVGVGAYISLFFAVCFFSGVFYKMPDAYRWLGAFDFTTLNGKFGSVSGAATFVGKGGLSTRAGFLFALSLVPGVMLALGLLEVLSHYGALKAAQKLMTPLLRPILASPALPVWPSLLTFRVPTQVLL